MSGPLVRGRGVAEPLPAPTEREAYPPSAAPKATRAVPLRVQTRLWLLCGANLALLAAMPVRQMTTTVLHYLGYDDDRGGIVSVGRALASTGRFDCVLGVNPAFAQARTPALATFELPAIAGETISLSTLVRARPVARAVRAWLADDPTGVFHGHSRAGLIVAGWLARGGERRVVASVHCYGRQRWFYRRAARQLGDGLFWLSPAMKHYYGIDEPDSWIQCVPGCVAGPGANPTQRTRAADAPLRLGGVGALVAWKRWHLVLEALAQLPAPLRARVRFTHIGAPAKDAASRAYATELRRLTTARGLDEVVTWRGEEPSADALLRESDCLVVASRHEPLAVAMLEALRAGVPVLASRSGGNVDVIADGRTGWFFESDDAADLARAIARLVESDALRRVEVRADDVARFEAGTVADQWAQIYRRRVALP